MGTTITMRVTRTTITRATSRGLALLCLVTLAACRGEGGAPSNAAPAEAVCSEPVVAAGPAPQHGGHVFALAGGAAWVEFVYDDGWGTLTIHLVDTEGRELEFDEAPYLNLVLDEEPRRVEGRREVDILTGEAPWVFEDDGLLGETERARFHLVVGGTTYVPPFAHAHGVPADGDGHGHESGADADVRPPPPGVVLVLSPLARLVVDHNAHWGVAHLRLIDHRGRPRGMDRPPRIHACLDERPVAMVGERGRDGGWYYEHDGLLGEPDRARLQLQVDGTVYIPPFPYRPHEHDHSHEITEDEGIGGPDHRDCDPRLCPLAPGAELR